MGTPPSFLSASTGQVSCEGLACQEEEEEEESLIKDLAAGALPFEVVVSSVDVS